ncbi:MAG: Gfo/Idh/MocA family oxidoreductase [Clostridia bacterium]
MIKIGIIGAGSISKSHIDAYQKNPNVEIYSFCDINEARLREMGETYGITRLFTDINEMLADPELQAVSVCTSNSFHAPCSIAAMRAGKDVLCEKPMATNVADALNMKRVSEETGKLLMIGFVRRFGCDCKILKDFVDNGYLGDIYYAKARYMRRHGCPGGWFSNGAISGGGPLIDLGVHIMDLTRYLMGSPKPVSVYGATFNKLRDRPDTKSANPCYAATSGLDEKVFDVEDLATAMVRYDNGAILQLETCFSINMEGAGGDDIELFGTKAGAKLDPSLKIAMDINGYMTNVTFCDETALTFDGLFEGEINHFADCIEKKTTCISTPDDGIMIMRIIEAIYESAKTGHEVTID